MGLSSSAGGGANDAESSADEWDAPIMAEINITPLTDIFLVLLIIFMVTSSVMSQMGVDVDLPQASQAMTKAQPDGVIITLLRNGAVKVNETQVASGDWEALKQQLGLAFQATSSRMVILEGDRKAFLGNVIELMDHARQAGAENFAIAAQTP